MAPDLATVELADCDARLHASLSEELRGEVVSAVEAVTGRRVAGYLTAHDPGFSILAFHFTRPRSR